MNHALKPGGEPSWRGIDEVPLEWCFQPGVKLDFRHMAAGYVVTPGDVEAGELRRDRSHARHVRWKSCWSTPPPARAMARTISSTLAAGVGKARHDVAAGARRVADRHRWLELGRTVLHHPRAGPTNRRCRSDLGVAITAPAVKSAIRIWRSCIIWKRYRPTGSRSCAFRSRCIALRRDGPAPSRLLTIRHDPAAPRAALPACLARVAAARSGRSVQLYGVGRARRVGLGCSRGSDRRGTNRGSVRSRPDRKSPRPTCPAKRRGIDMLPCARFGARHRSVSLVSSSCQTVSS